MNGSDPRTDDSGASPEIAQQISRLLESDLDPASTTRLFDLVYDELRRNAAQRLAALPPGQTLQATALVHEAYLRISGRGERAWQSRAQFFYTAARAMREIIIDEARRKLALKRGGGQQRVPLDDARVPVAMPDDEIIAIHEALEHLEAVNPDGARLVMLRFFAGLEADAIADALQISTATYHRRWRMLWAWLRREMGAADSDGA